MKQMSNYGISAHRRRNGKRLNNTPFHSPLSRRHSPCVVEGSQGLSSCILTDPGTCLSHMHATATKRQHTSSNGNDHLHWHTVVDT